MVLLAVVLTATSAVPAGATVGASRSVKKVHLTIATPTSVTLAGTKGQCLITADGYNIAFEGDDYPSLGDGGELASGGPGPATAANQKRLYTAFSATIDGTVYVEDDSGGLEAINAAVTLKVKKKTIKFAAYPIVASETGAAATMSGVVKCK
jgi:hypothetical protein